MPTIAEIQQAILDLPASDFVRLRHWFNELDWAEWDRKIETDSEAGRLDFLIAEAREAKAQGKLEKL